MDKSKDRKKVETTVYHTNIGKKYKLSSITAANKCSLNNREIYDYK